MLRCIKWRQTAKAFLLLWDKYIKENNCSLRRDWKREHMKEGERQEKRVKKVCSIHDSVI